MYDAKERGGGKEEAESTQYHRPPRSEDFPPPPEDADANRGSDSYLLGAKSIRLHAGSGRGGLAMRLAVPIIAALLVGFMAIAFIVSNRVFNLQIQDLKSDAANSAYFTGLFGRRLILHRNRFLRENPGYAESAEWRAGSHWLVTEGFVGEDQWVQATGFQLDEYAPITVMENAGRRVVLENLTKYIASGNTELAATFIVDENGTLLASSRREHLGFDPLALRTVPLPGHYVESDGNRIYVDYIETVRPDPVVRGVVRMHSSDEPDETLGTGVVILRTTRHNMERNSFLLYQAGLALALAAVMSLVCWYSARRVITPMRRMAADMRAIAEGDFPRHIGTVESNELGLLTQSFNSMAERLRIARLNEKETSRLESDLAVARSIQNNLLPPQTPRVRGLDIFTSYRPAREIGGDYFDFLPVDEGHMGVVVADASGKSIPAALVMSTTRAVLRFVAPGNLSAGETLTRVNSILSVDIPKGMFVTAYYIIFDPLERSMLCASAGHTPLLLARSDDTVEILNPGGIALGFDGGPIFQRSIREQRIKLESGDRVLLYTDGVVECVNTANEEYSDRRLREFLRRNRALSSHDFVGALMADLDRHRGVAEMRDDTTVVTFRVL